jgi:hypothetical protein
MNPTITIDGRIWTINNLEAIRRMHAERPVVSQPRFVSGCERCEQICVVRVSDCRCCVAYGTRTAGGSKIHATVSGGPGLFNYDENAKRHVRLLAFEDFLARTSEAA